MTESRETEPMPALGGTASEGGPPSWLFRYRIELLLGLLVVVVVGPVVQKNAAQQASRYALTAALFEEHTFVLDDYVQVLGIDRAVYDGHTYSDKAPGQPLLAVPFYALYRWVGGEPGTVLRVDGNLGLWWLTFWFSVLPAAGLAVLMYRSAHRIAPDTALAAAVGMTFGTILLPFSTLLFGHVLAALLGFSAFFLLSSKLSPARVALAGVLVGLSVMVEYTMAIMAVLFGAYVLVKARRKIGWFTLGGIPFAVALATYNWLVFGSPTALSYQWSAFSGTVETARAVGSIFSSFDLSHLVEVFLAPRGFLVATPIVVLGLVGSGVMVRRGDTRSEGLLIAAIFLGFLMLPLMWSNPWGGDSPGARYMVPVLPFLAPPLALVWRKMKLLSLFAAEAGVFTMGLATLTDPFVSREIGNGLGVWMGFAVRGEWVPTLLTMWVGSWGWVMHGSLVVGAATGLSFASRGWHRARSSI